jgi:hypothetical protein
MRIERFPKLSGFRCLLCFFKDEEKLLDSSQMEGALLTAVMAAAAKLIIRP